MKSLLRLGSIALLALVLLASSISMSAQIQRQISYQGLLTQPSGAPIADGDYGLVLRLYDAPTGGNLVYEETQTVSVAFGLFNMYIGAVSPLSGVNFEQQLWVETAIVGQTPFLPRTRLAVVPYAIRAEHATVADSIGPDITGVVRSLNGGQGDLHVVGTNGITVSRDGDTITVTGTLVGAGIEMLTSTDGTIDITNPNGPISDLSLADGAVTTTKIADGAVSNQKLADGSVSTTKIVDASVTLNKIAPGVIPTTLPPSGPAGGDLTGTYPNPLIRANAVTSGKIADGEVRTEDLADNSVTTGKLVNNSVTNPKLVDGAVTTSKLADNAVTPAKLANTTVVPGIYGSSLLVPRIEIDEDGRITKAEQVSIPDIPFTGPAAGDLTGTFPAPTIRPGVVTTLKLADGAVTNTKIGADAITTDKILNGTIKLEDLEPGLIPTTLPPSGPAGGILAGTYPNPSLNQSQGTQVLNALNTSAAGTFNVGLLPNSGVTAGTYGSVTQIPIITVDVKGRLTNVGTATLGPTTPMGPAGGDLQGTYPNPLINPTAGAGNRMVDAIRADYLAGDADINSPNNVVVLDNLGRLPAVDGSLVTNLNASNITQGVLPIERGGTNSSTTLANNRIMISSGGKIVESAPIAAQTFLIGTSTSTLPTPGTITAGPGINVSFSSPNFVISNTNAKLLAGTANDQTLRWDATFSQWVPNANLLATASGNVQANGNINVEGTGNIKGSTSIGSNPSSINRMGDGPNTTNSVGSPTATNYMYGETYINPNTTSNTYIGNLSGNTSSTIINVGTNGNLQLNGIDPDNPEKFLALDVNNYVRSTAASSLAKEGIVWQDYAFRLGGLNATVNPFLSDRFINLDAHRLSWTRLGGPVMMYIDGGANEVNITATTNINRTGSLQTWIGNPASRTTIGGQLDPRGNITNDAGNVVILDQTEIIGPTFINSGTDFNTVIGNQSSTADQSVAISAGTGPNGYIFMHNVKEDPTPLYMLTEDVFERVRKKLLADMADEGIQYQNGAFRLGAGESTPNYLREKSYDENRFVNLDEFAINFTDGSEGADGTMFVQFDGNNGGNTLVTVRSRTDVNTTGSGATNIGNAASTTTILGPTFVNAALTDYTQIGNGTGTAGNVGIGEPAIGSHLLTINGRPQTTATAFPDVRIDHLGGDEYQVAYVNTIENGVIIGDVNGDLIKWDENFFLNPLAWRVIGNDHPIVDGTNNLMGTLSNNHVHFITDFTNAGNYVMTMSAADQTLGIGTNGPGSGNYQVEIQNMTAQHGLLVDVSGPGAVGARFDAPDAGIEIGVGTTPIVGAHIEATGTGIVIGNSAPATGISMINNTVGLLIQNAGVASIDAEGTTFLNDNYNADNYLNTSGSTGNTKIGGGLAYWPGNRLTVDNTIDLIGNSYNGGQPAYRINNENWVWAGPNGGNVMVGVSANTTATGIHNNSLGRAALLSLTTGTDNVAVGTSASTLLQSGSENVALGNGALRWNVVGSGNVGVGFEAGHLNTGGSNTFVGHYAGRANTGTGNVMIGNNVGQTNFAGSSNILMIDNADVAAALIQGNFTTDQLTLNVAAGTAASLLVPGTAQTVAASTPNVRIGHLGGDALTTAYPNPSATNGIVTADGSGDMRKWDEATLIGTFAWLLGGNTSPSSNIFGTLTNDDIDVRTNNVNAMTINSADQNVGIGVTAGAAERLRVNNVLNVAGAAYNSGRPVVQINSNNFLWEGAGGTGNVLVGNTTNTTMADNNNTAVGTTALSSLTNGGANVAIGWNALTNLNNNYDNTAVGARSLESNSAAQNTAVGHSAGQNTSGPRNVFVGVNAGENAGGAENTMVGMFAGQFASGGLNTLFGTRAGRSATGGSNTIIGRNAGEDVASGNVIIGADVARTTFPAASNRLLIDNSDNATPLVEGDFSTDQFTLNVDGATLASFLVAGTAGTENVQMQSLGGVVHTDNFGDRVNDGIVVADGNGNLRKTAFPGSTTFSSIAANQVGNAGGVAANISGLSAALTTTGTYELEVYLMYNGTNPLDNFDIQIVGSGGATFGTMSYGLVSSGQAIAPSNVDGPGTPIAGIGVDAVPGNRLTILIKGFMTLTAPGSVDVQDLNAAGINYFANSYIKVTRLQ